MNWDYTFAAGILHFTTLVSVLIALYAWHNRRMPGGLALCLLMCAIAEWAFASGLEAAALNQQLKILLAKFEYLGVLSAPVLFLGFVLKYLQHDRWITLRKALLVSGIQFAGLILVATNEVHHLIWSGFDHPTGNPALMVFQHGPAYFIVLAYSYLLILTGVVLLLRTWWRESGTNRTRINIILVGALIPMVVGILYGLSIIRTPGLDIVPISFSATGLIVAFGIFRTGLFSILPVARDNLIENMRDGVLVLDNQGCIMDINQAAQRTIGVSAANIIRQHASRLPEEWYLALCPPETTLVPRREVSIHREPPLHLDVQITALQDRQHHPSGRLIVFHDITERHNTEVQLAMRANELGVLNRISLAITSGLDLERVMKTLHEQCNAIIPCDIFYIALYEETTGIIRMPLYYEKDYWVPPDRDIHKNPGLTGFIITTQKTLYIADTLHPQQEASIPPIRLGGVPARTYVGIPLLLRDKVIGVMSVQSYQAEAYNPEQIRLLETVAVEAAIAIENARLYGEVQRLAIVDELTGIYNFRGLIELGNREVERARRFNHPLAALFFDIDGFRNFNNTYSHTVGNVVLKEITLRCKAVLRAVDIFTRYGGDEFVVLLPETNKELALQVAQRLLAEAAAVKISTKDGELSVTISIGLTMLSASVPDFDTLIENANRGEHRAKEIGNCVMVDE